MIDDFTKHKYHTVNGQSVSCWDGIHTKHYRNGTYTGNFHNGQRSGQGKLEQKDGTVFDGQWLKDEKREGTETYSNGDVYIGKFRNGKR